MRSVLAFPGNMTHAQHIALALAEVDALQSYVTTFAFRRHGPLARALHCVPLESTRRLSRELARRSIETIPQSLVHTYPTWELLRTAASKSGASPVIVDAIWDRMSHAFDAMVARRYVPRTQAVHGFEYTALATFERARELGVATILHLPSLDSRAYELIQHREKANWPELTAEQDPYFHTKFERRYERRQKEIALADVIIANSQLTARSHIAAGADPEKVFVARLGAPPVHRVVQRNPHSLNQPLSVIWAGAFSLRKGAHYLIDALKRLDAREQIQVNVYGELTAPERLLRAAPNTVKFHGSVPRTILFEAFTHADVLVFPTLSDGFGMVITEALAHGLPVITTDCAGAAELIGPDNGVIVPSSDAAALADALRWCLDNRKQLFEMREDAAKAAHSRQWVDFRRDLIDVIEKGLSKTGFNPAFKRAA